MVVEVAEANVLLGDEILREAAKRVEVRLVRRRKQVLERGRHVPAELRLSNRGETSERAERLHETLHRAERKLLDRIETHEEARSYAAAPRRMPWKSMNAKFSRGGTRSCASERYSTLELWKSRCTSTGRWRCSSSATISSSARTSFGRAS